MSKLPNIIFSSILNPLNATIKVMKTNELAALLGISNNTLRNWEKYLVLEVPRDENGDRFYPPPWVAFFKEVKALKDAGYEYDEIKDKLTPPKVEDPDADLKAELAAVKSQLGDLAKENKSLKKQVTSLSSDLEALQAGQDKSEKSLAGLQTQLGTLQKTVEGLKGSGSNDFDALQKKFMGFFIGTWILMALLTLGILSITGQI